MQRVMVRYRVKPDQVRKNEELVRAVYRELAETKPAGIRYATFKLDDGVSFVHVASLETPDGQNPLVTLRAFQAFQENIKERCDEPPVLATLHEVGSYAMFPS